MTYQPDPATYWQPPHPQRPDSHVGAVVGAVFTALWLVFLAVASQSGSWLVAQVMFSTGLDFPGYAWPTIGVGLILLAAIPAVLVMVLPKHVPTRQAGRVWTIGTGALGVGSVLRAIPGTENSWLLLSVAIIAGVAALLLRRRRVDSSPGSFGWAVTAGLLVLAPFLWFGALGGLLETVLAILAALAVGALAAVTFDGKFWAAFGDRTGPRVVLGGLVAGVALTLIAAGTGGSGVQLLLLIVLPPLAFAAAALKRTFALVALAALGPLAFVDPVEVNIFLATSRDIPFWVSIAAGSSWAIALLVGLFYAVGLVKLRIGLAAATVVAVGAGLLYAYFGQPGFYGDQLFVVLKEQAPLTGLPTTTGVGPGRDERVTAVYRRLVEHAERTQQNLRAELDRLHVPYQPYYLVNAIRVQGGAEVRAWLELRDDVDRVLLDQRLRALPAPIPESHGPEGPPASPQWNLEMVGAPEVWTQGFTGKGIVVGSSDSGVDGSHPALASTFRGGDDSWYDPWDGSTTPNDQNGHGTHTLSTAVGKQNVGVAPDASWVACVNLDRGLGSPSLYLDCLQFMLAPFPHGGDPFTDGRPARAPHVLTNSWGCPELEGCDTNLVRPATDALAAAGIAFVAAAGNEGDRCGSIQTPPATDPAAFTVAAVNEQRSVAFFSSRGAADQGKPDIAAPGEHILSAMPGNTYSYLDGTSMATPHVAGVVALLWSARPELVGDVAGTYRLLEQTATPLTERPTCSPTADAGAGIINAQEAVRVNNS